MERAETNNSRGNEITHRERAIKAYISFFLSFFFWYVSLVVKLVRICTQRNNASVYV